MKTNLKKYFMILGSILGISTVSICPTNTLYVNAEDVEEVSAVTETSKEDALAVAVDGQAVKLTWNGKENQTATIYRADKIDGKYGKVATVDASKGSYIDGVAECRDYFYKILVEDVEDDSEAVDMEDAADEEKDPLEGLTPLQVTVKEAENLFDDETQAKEYLNKLVEEHQEKLTVYFLGSTKGKFLTTTDNMEVAEDVQDYCKRGKEKIYKITYTIAYAMTSEQEEQVETAIETLKNSITQTTTAEITEALYANLANKTVAGEGSTIYDVLVNHSGDSQAVAKTMQRLLDEFEIENKLVNSDGLYWNLVAMADGYWYDVDVYSEIKSIEKYEYIRYDYLLTKRLDIHKTNDAKNLKSATENWKFNKTTPINVSAYTDDRGLIITWDRVDHAGAYKVQRADKKDGTYTDVISEPEQKQESRGWTTTNEIIDTTAKEGQTYYYRVKAYTTLGDDSENGEYSDIYRITYCGAVQLSISLGSAYPYLQWDSVEDAVAYNIYRKETGKPEELIDKVTDVKYIDRGASKNTNYSYRIQIVRNSTSGELNEYFSNYVTTYGIEKVATTDNGMLLNIKSRAPEDAFRIYKYNSETKEYALIYVTSAGEFEYEDTEDIKEGETYLYRIAPYTETNSGRDINCKAIAKQGMTLITPDIAAMRINNIPVIMWSLSEKAEGYELYIVDDTGQEVLYKTFGCGENTAYLIDKVEEDNLVVEIRAIKGASASKMSAKATV